MVSDPEPGLGLTILILGGFGLIFLQGAKGFGLGLFKLGLSESSDSLGRSSCSWPEDEEESDNLDEDIETDSQSESFNKGILNEESDQEAEEEEDDLELLLRKCLRDFGLLLDNNEILL